MRRPPVRIIGMSGGGRNSPESYLAMALVLGAFDTLAKPFAIEELLDTVADAFSE